MELKEKNVVVTGASRGLGRALAKTLAQRGARVVLVARDLEALTQVVQEIEVDGGIAHAVEADVGDLDAAAKIAGIAAALLGPVDILVHNASTLGPVPLRGLSETRREAFERVLAVNLVGPFALTNAVVGSMVTRGEGLVLSISSDAAVEAYPTWGAYGASKAALDHLARVYAAELADQGVRFVSIDPGEMDTAMHAAAIPDTDPATLANPVDVANRIVGALGRLESGSRIAAADLPPSELAWRAS